MAMLLGVDGGGTGCRVAVADASGHVLAEAFGGPANIATNPALAIKSILDCAEDAFRTAVGAGFRTHMQRATAGLGLAGANSRGAADQILRALPFARARIVTDAQTTAMGALGGNDGIVAALGTGSVFMRCHLGQMQQFGGWGFVLGDEGSGARLARSAIARALRAHEGLAPASDYLSRLLEQLGGPEGAVAFSFAASPGDFAALAPDVIASDDPACRALWAESVSDVRQILTALQPKRPLPVTFTGGLGPATAAALADIPQRPAFGTALDGALALARSAA
jgi:glucosamine kinase